MVLLIVVTNTRVLMADSCWSRVHVLLLLIVARRTSHPGVIAVMMVMMMQFGRRLLLGLCFHFAIDILQGVADQHRSVQRLLGHLAETRQLEHGQVAHLQTTIAIALFVAAPTVASVAAASLWCWSGRMNGTRIDRNRCSRHRVITTAQFQVRLAVLRTPNRLLRMRMSGFRRNIVSAVVAVGPAVVTGGGLSSVLGGCS